MTEHIDAVEQATTEPMQKSKSINKTVALRVKLNPIDQSDQPIAANYTTMNVAPGVVYLDFGFLEPSLLTALVGTARAGKPVPQSLDGKLAVRVTMGYDVLQNLYQQLGQVLVTLAAGKGRKK